MQGRPAQPPKAPLAARLPFFYGWVVLGVTSVALFISGPGQTYSVSIFVDPIIDDLETNRTVVSGLYTAGSLTGALVLVLVGRLLDRFGARIVLVCVALLFGLATMAMSRVDSPAELYLGFAAIRALGQGSMMLAGTTMVALWFVRMRGRAMALATMGAVASQAGFPPLVHFLITRLEWRDAWVALGFLIWASIPVLLLARRSPESLGLRPDGGQAPKSAAGTPLIPGLSPGEDFTLGEAVRTRSFWLLLFASIPHPLIMTALVFHMVSLVTSKGLDGGLAAPVLSAMALVSLGGTFLAGYLSERIPNRYIIAASQALLAASMVWALVIDSPWQALAMGATMGVSAGLSMTTNNVIWPNYYGRRNLGAIRGVTTTCMVGFAALGPFPFGFLFDLTDSYTWSILGFLALPVACGVAALRAFPPTKPSAIDTARAGG